MLMVIHYMLLETKKIMNLPKEVSDELFYWFANNQMEVNPEKCHLLTSISDEVSICADN